MNNFEEYCTKFVQAVGSKKTREFLGISDGLVRISMGLENPQDIKDFTQTSR